MLIPSLMLSAALQEPVQTEAPKPQAERLSEIVQAWHEAGEFDGLALVAQDGEIVAELAVGTAHRGWEVPHRADAVFPIASLTKQVTAVLVLQAAERGELRLDWTLDLALPGFPESPGKRVTLEHLLRHTGGFQDPPLEHYLDPRHADWDDTRILQEYLMEQAPDFVPGSVFRYSNADYHLLGAVLEARTGLSFAELVEQRIAQPLGLKETGLARRSEVRAKRPQDYGKNEQGEWFHPAPYDWSHWRAAGGLESSLRDLHRWNLALHRYELLSEEMTETMLTPLLQPSPYLGLGSWVYDRPIPGTEVTLRIAERRGAIGGHAVLNALDLKRGDWVILYSNHGNPTLDSLSYAPCLPLDLFSSLYGGTLTRGGAD